MQRRRFLKASMVGSALTGARLLGQGLSGGAPHGGAREFYLLRRYQLQSGPQTKLCEDYFAAALLPALTRLGMGPIGLFRTTYGEQTPAFYALIAARALDDLAMLDLRLGGDPVFLKAAAPFWEAPATAPAFQRVESSLLAAFEGWPRVTPPAAAAAQSSRILQLRTYESPSDAAHVRKVEMFHRGEFELFVKAGAHPVFFGDTLVGPRMPNLTYMLSFAGMAEMEKAWDAFRDAPGWKALQANTRYSYEAIVSNISNLLLSPLAASQI